MNSAPLHHPTMGRLRIMFLPLGRRTPESIDLPVPGTSKHEMGQWLLFFLG